MRRKKRVALGTSCWRHSRRPVIAATLGNESRLYTLTPSATLAPMIRAEDLVGEEWAEWYRLTPAERWAESTKLWQTYLALGGSLDPEPDTQSPFFDAEAPCPSPPDGRPSLRVLRRGRV